MQILTKQNKHLPCITNKEYEITLFLMFNREFMNDVYRTFRIISRGLQPRLFCCFGEGNFLFIYFSLKGKGEQLKNKFDKLKRTKRGITYINILHTLQKVERKLLDKLERKLYANAPKEIFASSKENLQDQKFYFFNF